MGPNWFESVMGTGIVANAGAALPVHVVGLRLVATAVRAAASLWLCVLVVAALVHRRRDRGPFDDSVLVQFWGAPPMALMTVGSGTLLVGRDWIGLGAGVRIDAVLWCAGTALGLAVVAQGELPAPYATGAAVFGLFYGLPAFGFALLWACLTLTPRTRTPFSLTGWSFTFPVGTVATGLATATGSTLLAGIAAVLFVALVAMWARALTRTTQLMEGLIPQLT